jgi:hypothetical protein
MKSSKYTVFTSHLASRALIPVVCKSLYGRRLDLPNASVDKCLRQIWRLALHPQEDHSKDLCAKAGLDGSGFRPQKFILALRQLEFIMDSLFRACTTLCSLTINPEETANSRFHHKPLATGFLLPVASAPPQFTARS